MMSIRKFVGYTGAAAGIATAIALATSSPAAARTTPVDRVTDDTYVAQFTPTAACSAALQELKDAVVADMAEDNAERTVAKTNPGLAVDQSEDASEVATFKSLFSAAVTACAPAVSSTASTTSEQSEKTFTASAQCTAAIQALKAAWAQGRPTTIAQWQQLQALAQAVRTACGWTWTGAR